MRMNNKGLSLVELLVVMAVSTIVLLLATSLIVNSSRMYSRETNTIDVQNEAQLVINNLNEAFMEASKLEVSDDGNSRLIVLGEHTDDNVSATKSYCRHLFFVEDKKFLGLLVASPTAANDFLENGITDLAGNNSEELAGYQLSNLISDFRITYDPVCYKGVVSTTNPDGSTENSYYLTNPVKVKCKFTIATPTYSYDYEVSVQLRNSLTEARLPLSLNDQSDIRPFKVVNR